MKVNVYNHKIQPGENVRHANGKWIGTVVGEQTRDRERYLTVQWLNGQVHVMPEDQLMWVPYRKGSGIWLVVLMWVMFSVATLVIPILIIATALLGAIILVPLWIALLYGMIVFHDHRRELKEGYASNQPK